MRVNMSLLLEHRIIKKLLRTALHLITRDFSFLTLLPIFTTVPITVQRMQELTYLLTKDVSFPFALIGATELGFFAQDKWRVKDNFTLTYGLRADVPIFQNK